MRLFLPIPALLISAVLLFTPLSAAADYSQNLNRASSRVRFSLNIGSESAEGRIASFAGAANFSRANRLTAVRLTSSGDEVDGSARPWRIRIPCVDFVQRNEANNPETHRQARQADGEAITLDAVPSPQQAPDDQGHDHDRDGDACRNLQASAVFVPAPLPEDAAQEVSEPAQQAEAARCLHQGEQEKHTRQSRPDQCVGAWQAVVLGPSASNSGPQAE